MEQARYDVVERRRVTGVTSRHTAGSGAGPGGRRKVQPFHAQTGSGGVPSTVPTSPHTPALMELTSEK